MVILVKIVKIYQLQMGVVSRELMMHSGFFRLKHSPTIAGQKKLHKEGFLWQPSSQKNSQVTMAKWTQDMLVPEGSKQ